MDLDKLKIDRAAPTSRRRRRGPPFVLPLVLLCMAGAVVWLFRAPLRDRLDALRLPRVRAARVAASHPAAAGAVRGTAANGYVVARRRAALSADTPGRIVEMLVEEGSVVRKGDVVARIYSEEYEAALRRAESEVAVAEAAVRTAQASIEAAESEIGRLDASLVAAAKRVREDVAGLELAELSHGRTSELVSERISSTMDLDDARVKLEQAEARLESSRAEEESARAATNTGAAEVRAAVARLSEATARLASARASRDEAAAVLEKTEVRAPFDGIVVLKDAEVGEVVSPNVVGGTSARGSVCTMVDFASLEVQADVPETSLSAVREGARASVYLDAYPERTYTGRVSRIWPTADRQKATIEVRVVLDAPDERLRPEMGVRVVFLPEVDGEATEAQAPAAEPRLLVPIDAVVVIDGRDGVFVLERDVARFRPVERGAERSGRVAIDSGLSDGERIVLSPPGTLVDGDRVRVEE